MTQLIAKGISLMTLAVGLSAVAQAAPVVIFNTGTGLAAGATDLNWSLTYTGPGTQNTGGLNPVVAGPIPWPIANTAASSWIAPTQNQAYPPAAAGVSNSPGLYTFRQTFNLSATAGAILTGQFAGDNSTQVFLNGLNTGFSSATFASFTPFLLNSGFLIGANTLEFRVTNDPDPSGSNPDSPNNPIGLRVDNLALDDGAVVPELDPSSATVPLAFLFVSVLLAGGRRSGRRLAYLPF